MTEPVSVGNFPFRFQCQPGCTNCCTQTGHVYVTDEDIERIAAFLGLERRKFESRYVYRVKNRARLTVPAAHSCHFLMDGGCSIHAVKPLQCRVFPYWPENVPNRSSWKALRRYCPGVGVGPLIQIETVRAEAQSYRDAFPEL